MLCRAFLIRSPDLFILPNYLSHACYMLPKAFRPFGARTCAIPYFGCLGLEACATEGDGTALYYEGKNWNSGLSVSMSCEVSMLLIRVLSFWDRKQILQSDGTN